MPCRDCNHWNRVPVCAALERFTPGWCEVQHRAVFPHYHCPRWVQREVTHAEVGLTRDEVAWARQHRDDPSVRALNFLFRRIQFQPQNPAIRAEFTTTLEIWRSKRRIAFGQPEEMP